MKIAFLLLAVLLSGCTSTSQKLADGITATQSPDGGVLLTLSPGKNIQIRNDTGVIIVGQTDCSIDVTQVANGPTAVPFSVIISSPTQQFVIINRRIGDNYVSFTDEDGDTIPDTKVVHSRSSAKPMTYHLKSMEWEESKGEEP